MPSCHSSKAKSSASSSLKHEYHQQHHTTHRGANRLLFLLPQPIKGNLKMTTTKTTITRPADLDNSKLHTRAEVRAWQDANFEYHAAIHAEEQRAATQAAAKAAEASRPLSDDEYYQQAVQRETEKRARIADREAAEKADQEAKVAYLESTPAIADIDATNPYSFLLQVIAWAQKGYTLPEDADIATFPSWYAVKLTAPAPAPAPAAANSTKAK
jgi:hypothetical protein